MMSHGLGYEFAVSMMLGSKQWKIGELNYTEFGI
jgi:hypothetical protein